jgi:acetoin utilization protein AcuB
MELARVGDLMTRDVISIAPDLGIDTALELMGANDVRRLPVISSTNRVIGIISKNDVMAALPRGSEPPNLMPTVRDVMTDYVYTIGPDESVARAAEMMMNHEISCLPVLQDHEPVGIITESDLFRYLAQRLQTDGPTTD